MAAKVRISSIKPIVTCPATLYLPGDNGTFDVFEFKVIFKRITDKARQDLQARHVKGEITGHALLDEVVEGWEGLLDENDTPVPYSVEERIATNDAYPGLAEAMVVSWYDNFFYYQREAATKNSKAPSATA